MKSFAAQTGGGVGVRVEIIHGEQRLQAVNHNHCMNLVVI